MMRPLRFDVVAFPVCVVLLLTSPVAPAVRTAGATASMTTRSSDVDQLIAIRQMAVDSDLRAIRTGGFQLQQSGPVGPNSSFRVDFVSGRVAVWNANCLNDDCRKWENVGRPVVRISRQHRTERRILGRPNVHYYRATEPDPAQPIEWTWRLPTLRLSDSIGFLNAGAQVTSQVVGPDSMRFFVSTRSGSADMVFTHGILTNLSGTGGTESYSYGPQTITMPSASQVISQKTLRTLAEAAQAPSQLRQLGAKIARDVQSRIPNHPAAEPVHLLRSVVHTHTTQVTAAGEQLVRHRWAPRGAVIFMPNRFRTAARLLTWQRGAVHTKALRGWSP